MRTQHNENSNTTTTTLVIRNPQSNDGDYMCVFTDIANGWTLSRNIFLQELCKWQYIPSCMTIPLSVYVHTYS